MSHRPIKRRSSSKDDALISHTEAAKDEEKTIPFLRRLCDMLEENGNAISFYPGCRKNGQDVLGRIVVHDRAKMEAEVLPKYFNHASFASLRRQLNYFSFSRVGKGRTRGAIYCNEAVVELHDILQLKRRTSGNHGPSASQEAIHRIETPSESSTTSSEPVLMELESIRSGADDLPVFSVEHTRSSGVFNSVIPVVHVPLSHHKGPRSLTKRTKNKRCTPKLVSPPSTSPVPHDPQEPRVTLDLTVPPASIVCTSEQSGESPASLPKDDDILEGCNALLSFSSGLRQPVGLA